MTKVVFFKSNDSFWGFEEQGHTGFDASGNDILCSAISAMTMLVINAIEVAYASDVDYEIDEEAGTCITTDLLVDVIIMPDGFVKVMDLDELADAVQAGYIDTDTLQRALLRTNTLLNSIYRNEFITYKQMIEEFE